MNDTTPEFRAQCLLFSLVRDAGLPTQSGAVLSRVMDYCHDIRTADAEDIVVDLLKYLDRDASGIEYTLCEFEDAYSIAPSDADAHEYLIDVGTICAAYVRGRFSAAQARAELIDYLCNMIA